MFSLKDHHALVTGAGRGIGRAIAIALAQAGAKVGITARTAAVVLHGVVWQPGQDADPVGGPAGRLTWW